MRAALIIDGLVENVILVGEDYTPPAGYALVPLDDDDAVGPGWAVDPLGGWTAPEDPEPAPPSQLALMQQQINELTDLVLFGF